MQPGECARATRGVTRQPARVARAALVHEPRTRDEAQEARAHLVRVRVRVGVGARVRVRVRVRVGVRYRVGVRDRPRTSPYTLPRKWASRSPGSHGELKPRVALVDAVRLANPPRVTHTREPA